jgi:hypothetical protein
MLSSSSFFLYVGFLGMEEAKNLRVGDGDVSAPEKMQPFAGLRGIARAALNRRRWSLGQGGAGKGVGACRPRTGLVAVRPAVGLSEVEKRTVY